MNENDSTKFVDFDKYCPHCEYSNKSGTEDPCNECLTYPVNVESHKPVNFKGDYIAPIEHGYYDSMIKIKDYLYDVLYNYINYDAAYKYFKRLDTIEPVAGCSAVRNGPWYGRNLDWFYNESAEFVVHTSKGGGYATLGVAGGMEALTNEFVESGEHSELYRIIPFRILDGINDQGVTASINVVPHEIEDAPKKTTPEKNCEVEVCSLMLVRFILDHFPTAKKAVEYIRDHVSVYFIDAQLQYGYEAHFMVADRNETYVLEFIDGKNYIIDVTDKPYITNFHIKDVIFNDDGTVYTPETQDADHNAIDTNHITYHGSGLERYNYIVNNYEVLKYGIVTMRALLEGLTYTKAYSTSEHPADPFWYTEFVMNEIGVASPVEDFEHVVDVAGQYYINRSRRDGNKTWQTVHSSLYNLLDKKLHLITQEDGNELIFSI